eukprot:TRINITY_DN2740_c0_g1_i4.p2 TRINITY_DN2740_c0_g1~~TRINITY_DN2740_c0_g1_i4.p2  ORF type:complete len:103 (+),score=23.42 TRINITY_DN2740_c0_g1_i4:508-816(+)
MQSSSQVPAVPLLYNFFPATWNTIQAPRDQIRITSPPTSMQRLPLQRQASFNFLPPPDTTIDDSSDSEVEDGASTPPNEPVHYVKTQIRFGKKDWQLIKDLE